MTAQMLLLEQGRERDEQLGTQREQESFIGTPAKLKYKNMGEAGGGEEEWV